MVKYVKGTKSTGMLFFLVTRPWHNVPLQETSTRKSKSHTDSKHSYVLSLGQQYNYCS